jgi:hypothetical protein
MDDFNPQSPSSPVILYADDDQIHIAIHEGRQKEPSFLELPPDVQSLYQQHIEAHNQQAQQKQQMQMMQMAQQAMMTGQPPQPPPAQGHPQEHPTRKGPATPREAKNAIVGGDIPPNSAPGAS